MEAENSNEKNSYKKFHMVDNNNFNDFIDGL